jgi:hypothetical protein
MAFTLPAGPPEPADRKLLLNSMQTVGQCMSNFCHQSPALAAFKHSS